MFRGKEVLVKLITFVGAGGTTKQRQRSHLIAAISKATNAQTKVDDYDRRANDPLQQELQLAFFDKFGLLYERKRGEFSDGIRNGYVSRNLMINRERLVRVSLACEFRVNQARAGIAKFASEKDLADLLKLSSLAKHAYGYEALNGLDAIRKKGPEPKGDRFQTRKYGQALRYGQYAVVAVCANNARNRGIEVPQALDEVLSQWPSFEGWASKLRSNREYRQKDSFDFISYYKGSTINEDVRKYNFKLAK